MTSPQYAPGDLVIDTMQDPDERTTIVVLDYLFHDDGSLVRANEHEPPGLNASVASVNPADLADEPVVQVAFRGWLDETVVGWRNMLHAEAQVEQSFRESITQYCREWGVQRQVYAYPEARLAPRRYCPEHNVRAEYVPTFPEAGEPEAYVCPVESCGVDHVTPPEDPLNALDERITDEDGEVVAP